MSWLVDKTLLFLGRTIEEPPLCVKEKGTTTSMVSCWIGVWNFDQYSVTEMLQNVVPVQSLLGRIFLFHSRYSP